MNESNKTLLSKAVAQLNEDGTKFLTWKEVKESPEFREYGQNRGLRLQFHKGDVLHFPPLESAVFFTTDFKSRDGNTYHVLKTLAIIESAKWGKVVRQIPAAIFCRIPSLIEEQNLLWEDNALGHQLAEQEADYLRLKLLCEIGDVTVTWVSGEDGEKTMHTDRWHTDKETGERVCVYDSPDLPDSERAILRVHKFAPVKK